MGVILLGGDGKFLYTNEYFTTITGYQPDEIKDVNIWFLKAYPDTDYRNRAIAQWQEDTQDENATKIFNVTCKSGQVKTIEFQASFQSDQVAMVTLKDITEQREYQETVRRNKNTLESIFKAAPAGIGMVKDRIIMQANNTLCKMTGFADKDLVGKSARVLYPTQADYEEVGTKKYEQIKQHGTGTVETRWQTKDGNILNILLSSTPVNVDDWSEGVTFTALDITERKQMETDLKKSESRYRRFFEEIISGAFIATEDGRLLDCNREFLNIFGFSSKKEALSTNLNTLHQKLADRKKFIGKIKTQKRVRHFQSMMKKIDGSPIHTLENSYGVFDKDGKLKSIRGYLSDITDITTMERQLRQAQKMEAIGTLVGGISHDFNNLLQAIMGYTELLFLNKKEDDPDYDNLCALKKMSKRAGDLVKQLLIFSRDAQTKKVLIELNHEINQGKNLLEKTIPRMISIQTDLFPDLWPIEADPLQIEQIILNLGSNASDAMPDGGQIRIRTQNKTIQPGHDNNGIPSADYILITISDTGHGMDAETLEKVFDPFFTTKTIGKGTGLGLSSVYGIIKNHDGYIRCKSIPGKGTQFQIYLPASKGKHVRVNDKPLQTIKSGHETILVVDDEDAIRELLSEAFENMGYTYLEAVNGEDAIEIYKNKGEKIDLVVLDLSMPGMGGFKCLKEMISIDPNARILMASGYSADTTVTDCTRAGAKGYIRKPYQLNDFFDKIRQILDQAV